MPISDPRHFGRDPQDPHCCRCITGGNVAHSGDSFSCEIGSDRGSSVADCSSDVDLESGLLELKLHLDNKAERDCRICHLGLESCDQEYGVPIQLGCSCKGDLGTAHKKCAETWFKIKGNMTCEICGATALNVAGDQMNQANNAAANQSVPAAPVILVETRTFWHSRRLVNFLLGCMVFAFVISWFFHFRILT